jgi:hypothetical protein
MTSNWWKNIVALENEVPGKNWFVDSIVRKVGCGNSTFFWTAKWIGETSLDLVYPRLFSLSNEKDGKVGDLLVREGDRRSWLLTWRRRLFQWEEESLSQLMNLLGSVDLSSDDDS